MKKLILLLFFFSVVFSASFINYYNADSTGNMFRADALSSDYSVREHINYHLNTKLGLINEDGYLSGPIGSSADNLLSGSVVCEGGFRYDTGVNAITSQFDGHLPAYSGFSHSPNDWPNCNTYPDCPGENKFVYWSNSQYNSHINSGQLNGGPHLYSNAYSKQSIDYEDVSGGRWFNGEVAEVATVAKGSASLKRGSTNIYSFGSLSGNSPSHSGTFSLHPSSPTTYTFTQRMDVNGLLMGVFNFNKYADREGFYSYNNPDAVHPYTKSNIHANAVLNVYPEDSVGIIPPSIVYVDVGNRGPFAPPGPYEVSPGEDIPVTILMFIPNRPSKYYALPFEFYRVGVGGGPYGITFSVDSGINQCNQWSPFSAHVNGGWTSPHSGYSSSIKGVLHIPNNLPEGKYVLPFSVSYISCNGAEDCDGNGVDETALEIHVEVEIPGAPDADLTCAVEPITYIDGIPPSASGFISGQGVESWRVRVTNIGTGDAVISTSQMLYCSALLFNAYNSDGTRAFSSFWRGPFFTSVPNQLNAGDSITFDIDARALCSDVGSTVGAMAWVNLASSWYAPCTLHQIPETDYLNNVCRWNMPCTKAPALDECELVPANYNNPPSGEDRGFDLTCNGLPCVGTVGWGTTGDTLGTITDSDQTKATVSLSYTDSDRPGLMYVNAVVGYPENMICNATITLDSGSSGSGTYCELWPTPQNGYPGSKHKFHVECFDSEDSDAYCSNSDWSITNGLTYVEGGDFLTETDAYGILQILHSLAIGTGQEVGVSVRTTVEPSGDVVVCEGKVVLPPMDCYDLI